MNILLWFGNSDHWLVILGDLLACLGVGYGSYSFFIKKHWPVGSLTYAFAFGLVGGTIIAAGLGVAALILVVLTGILSYFQTGSDGSTVLAVLKIVPVFRLVGFLLGVIFEFILGFWIMRTAAPPRTSIRKALILLISPSLLFLLSQLLRVVLLTVQPTDFVPRFLDIPLLCGCVYGFIYAVGNRTSLKTYIIRQGWIFGTLLLLCIVVTFWAGIDFISDMLEFIFGFFIISAFNFQSPYQTIQAKPSWGKLFFWVFLGSLLGTGLLVLSFFFDIPYIFYMQEFVIVLGLVIGINQGRLSSVIIQAKNRASLTTQNLLKIDWSRVIKGFLVGLVIFGLYASGPLLPISLTNYLSLFLAVLTGGIVGGCIVGSIYGFGAPLFSRVNLMNDDDFAFIALVLTVVGIIVQSLPSLLG